MKINTFFDERKPIEFVAGRPAVKKYKSSLGGREMISEEHLELQKGIEDNSKYLGEYNKIFSSS